MLADTVSDAMWKQLSEELWVIAAYNSHGVPVKMYSTKHGYMTLAYALELKDHAREWIARENIVEKYGNLKLQCIPMSKLCVDARGAGCKTVLSLDTMQSCVPIPL